MDQPLQYLVTGKHIAGDDNISPAEISDDLTQIYHNYFLSALQFPYIPSYNFPNINLDNKNINIGDYCSLTNQKTFKKPKPESEMTSFHFTPTVLFSQLPGLDLHSLEHVTNPSLTNYFKLIEPTPVQQSNRVRVNEKKRIRLKNISDKTWSLQKLLPSSYKKMDMATVYDEASKYIKYLKAQIKVLEAMSVGDHGFGVTGSCSGSNFGCESNGYGNGNDSGDDDDGYGALEKLKRSELLEVLVNSDSAQGMMYSRGFCVYSVEQKLLLKEFDDKHLLSTDPSFYN